MNGNPFGKLHISTDSLLEFCPLKYKRGKIDREGRQIEPDKIYSHQFNIGQILRFHPYWSGRLQYDELSNEIWYNTTEPLGYDTSTPGTPEPIPGQENWVQFTDLHTYQFIDWFIDWYDIKGDKNTILQAVWVVASENSSNPLTDYLDNLKPWNPDEDTPQLDTWLIRYFGVVDTVLARAYARKILIAALARIYLATEKNPVKVDTLLSLYGGQGIKKSTALEALCFYSEFGRRYFSDALLDMSSKDAVQIIQGKVIYELKELAKRTKDRNLEKAFIDMQIDRVRVPWGKLPQNFVRRTVFIITTNDREIFSDPTGSRRFWPLECAVGWEKHQEIDTDSLMMESINLWREALYYLKQYKEITEELVQLRTQRKRDDYQEKRQELLEKRKPYEWWLDKDQEDQRDTEAMDYTDQHPLTEKVLLQLQQISTPITMDKIMNMVFPETGDKTRRNKAIVKDILLTQGYTQYRYTQTGKAIRAWRKK